MSSRKKVIIKLTDEQRNEIESKLGKEATHIIFQLIGGSQLIVDIYDIPDINEP